MGVGMNWGSVTQGLCTQMQLRGEAVCPGHLWEGTCPNLQPLPRGRKWCPQSRFTNVPFAVSSPWAGVLSPSQPARGGSIHGKKVPQQLSPACTPSRTRGPSWQTDSWGTRFCPGAW